MGRFLLIALGLLLLNCTSVFSQMPSWRAMLLNPNVYRTLVDMDLIRVSNKYGAPLPKDTYSLKARLGLGLDYKIVSEDENGYLVIRILPRAKLITTTNGGVITKTIEHFPFNKADPVGTSLPKGDSQNASNYLFAIKADELPVLSKIELMTKIVGTPLIHPFKLRSKAAGLGPTLNTEFTVSYSFGIRVKLSKKPFVKNFLTFIPYGVGIGESEYIAKKEDGISLTEGEDSAALTYFSWGLMYTFNNKVNLGVFNGYDAMINKQNDWIHQSKPWFSFGIGYKFDND